MKEQHLVGITKAAAMIGVHPNTLRKWADDGLVPHIKLPSGYRRFEVSGLKEFRERLEVSEGKLIA